MYRLYNPLTSPALTNDTYIYDIIPTAHGLVNIASDNKIRLLDLENLEAEPLVKGSHRDVTCVRMLGDGMVVTGGRDGRVSVRDLRSGKEEGGVRSGMFIFPFLVMFSFSLRLVLCFGEDSFLLRGITDRCF